MNYTDFGTTSALLKTTISNKAREEKKKGDRLEAYKNQFSNKEKLLLHFSRADKEGNMSLTDGDVTVLMPNRDETGIHIFKPIYRSQRLQFQYECEIVAIDEKKKIVTVKSLRNTQREIVINKIEEVLAHTRKDNKKAYEKAVRDVERQLKDTEIKASEKTLINLRHTRINEEYVKNLKAANVELVTAPALVTEVYQNYLSCDIMGLGIPARLSRYEWAYTFTGTLKNVVKVGDQIDITVKGKARPEKTETGTKKTHLYTCSRLPIIDNPWDTMPYKVGDYVMVTCTDITSSGWFGNIDGYEQEIFVEFSDKSNIRVILGNKYECKIYRFNRETRSIKARIVSSITF